LGVAVLSGCLSFGRGTPGSRSAEVIPSYNLAILPFENETNSVKGALYLREVMQEKIGRRGYRPRPLSEVDQILSDQFGISLGGQIADPMLPEIGLALGVDTVMTGTVHRFGIGVTDRDPLDPKGEVEGTFRLHDTASGEQLWEGHKESRWDRAIDRSSERDPTISSVGADLLLNLAFVAFGRPLLPVVETFCDELLAEMPHRSDR